MKFFGGVPSAANRFFQVQFKDIHIHLGATLRPVFRGGFLRAVRRLAPSFALFVAAVFCIHCVKPIVSYWAVGKNRAQTQINAISQERLFYQVGLASWYGGQHGQTKDGFGYRRTASGEIMDPDALICAHRTLPFGTVVQIDNLSNGRSTLLKVVDRGPYVGGRVIDISLRAAREIGLLKHGLADVRVQVAKSLLLTNRPIAPPKTAHDSFPDTGEPYMANGLNLPALLFSLHGPAIPKDRVRSAPWERLSSMAQNLEDIMGRFKNRRLDPFINRKP
jgi:3D (Asp-Asp-Asp) domain-containing protein